LFNWNLARIQRSHVGGSVAHWAARSGSDEECKGGCIERNFQALHIIKGVGPILEQAKDGPFLVSENEATA